MESFVGGHASFVALTPTEEGSLFFFLLILFIALERADTVSSHAGLSQSSCFLRNISSGEGLSPPSGMIDVQDMWMRLQLDCAKAKYFNLRIIFWK